ncbi:MAG: MFS transporter, partial [Gemmatimonadetes bacterium]|nr:MFS transporter [Gemmatimonadota bacterium]
MPDSDPNGDSDGSNPRRRILTVGGFAHFVHDGFTDCVYVLLPLWAAAFALNHAEVGALKMVMSGTMAAFQVPAGILAERYGERAILAWGTVVAGVGFILLGWADGFLSLLLFLAIAGLGGGTQHPLVSSLISRAYAGAKRRAALGTYNFTGDLGKVAAPAAV